MTVQFYLKNPLPTDSGFIKIKKISRPHLQEIANTETLINAFLLFEGKRFKISTGEKIKPRFWNPKTQRAIRSFPGCVEFNSKLDGIGEELKKIYRNSTTNKIVLSKELFHQEMMKYLKPNVSTKKSFFDYYDEFVSIKKAISRPNTIKKFRSLQNHLRHFEKYSKSSISFERMDAKFYEQFTAFLITDESEYSYFNEVKKQEVKRVKTRHLNNSVGKYIGTLKGFLHWATEREYNKHTAFLKFKTPREEADIVYLTEEELIKLFLLDLKNNERLRQVREVFCFGCFTGLRYSDIQRLRKENVKDEEIHFVTKKTKDSLIVPLNDFAKEILLRNDFHLPVISNQKTNQNLKELGAVAGISNAIILTKFRGAEEIQTKAPKHNFMTSHTARRTFVTLSLEKGMRPETVMSITGHKDYKTFKKYIKITSKVKLVEMKRVWNKDSSKLLKVI